MNYILDGAIVDVNASEWDLMSGEIGTVESIRNEMQGKFRDYIMAKVFTALTSIWTESNTADNYTDVGGDVTKTALDAMIKYINRTTAGAKAIVGTRTALYPIQEFAGFAVDPGGSTYHLLPSVAEEVARTGWVGAYKGVPLVVVNEDRDNIEDYNILVPTDKILVVGENVGEFITFGEPIPSEYTDNQPVPPRRHFRVWEQFGMLIDHAMGIGVLELD